MANLDEFVVATRRAAQRRRIEPGATEAHYDRRRARIVINLKNGLELAFPPQIAEGLEKATVAELSDIEISPSGFGIHFPKLDAHLHLPALLRGVFGSKKWMAAQLGGAVGMAGSAAKRTTARANGRRGGRPRKLGVR
jgi:hypothetical protein